MWDLFLIIIAQHPFASCILPIAIAVPFSLFKQGLIYRATGTALFSIGVLIGLILHFKWDSFSIHFSEIQEDSFSEKRSVLFLGDSITCEGSRPRGFITKIQSVLPIDHHVVCQKGATGIELAGLLEKASLPLNPAFIIAQSGINDLLNGGVQDQVLRSQEILFERLVTKFPRSKVLFLPIHPLKFAGGAITEFPSLSPVNFSVWWEDPPSFVQDSLLADGVHLSAHGHSLLAKNIVNKIISGNSRQIH